MKKLFLSNLLLLILSLSQAQIVSLDPGTAGPDDFATLIFDASEGNGELIGASKVYVHHGVITDSPTGTDWQYVIGNWGQDDGIGEMAPVAGQPNKWQLELTPTLRSYFGVPSGEGIFRLALVFRSADGTVKGTIAPGNYGWGTVDSNLDIYLNLNPGNYITLNSPSGNSASLNNGQPISVNATASSAVTSMKVWIDEGSGYAEKASVTSGTTISYTFVPANSGIYNIKITAIVNGENLEFLKEYAVTILQQTVIEALPPGVIAGINYDDTDATKATLVLQAPDKDFAFVVGDLPIGQLTIIIK